MINEGCGMIIFRIKVLLERVGYVEFIATHIWTEWIAQGFERYRNHWGFRIRRIVRRSYCDVR